MAKAHEISDKMPIFAEKYRNMALAISSIPVLTGEVAEKFERQAQQTYETYLHRTEAQKRKAKAQYEHGMKMVQKILAKSKLKAK